MESIIDQITDENTWKQYLEFKKNQLSYTQKEIEELEKYIQNKDYLEIATKISLNTYIFSTPEKHLINKIDKSKKRAVYTLTYTETMVLKLITYLFTNKYDNKYSDNCYSFRRKYTIKDALYKLYNPKNKIETLPGYKIDISNYFNTINLELLLPKLKTFIKDDPKLYRLIENILTNPNITFKRKNNTRRKRNNGRNTNIIIFS